jgi:predicted secreted protein
MSQIELGPADNGQQVPVSRADAILVRLPESGATGYGWDVALAGPAQIVGDEVAPPPGPVAGAALVRGLWLAVDRPGQVTFRAVRHNPWDATVEEYNVVLDVT